MNLTASHITATGALGHFELPAPVVGARRTLTPAEVGTAGPIGTWNLPQEIIVNILDPEVDQAPGLITVQVSLAPPGAVLFYIDGAQVWADTATDTGVVGPLSLSVDEDLAAGDHVLSVTASGATGADHFTIAQSPAILPAPITPDRPPTSRSPPPGTCRSCRAPTPAARATSQRAAPTPSHGPSPATAPTAPTTTSWSPTALCVDGST
jgi:hypothetical protein